MGGQVVCRPRSGERRGVVLSVGLVVGEMAPADPGSEVNRLQRPGSSVPAAQLQMGSGGSVRLRGSIFTSDLQRFWVPKCVLNPFIPGVDIITSCTSSLKVM